MISKTGNLRCEFITDFSHLEQISGDWHRLWQADSAREIFYSFAWARAWWRAYSHECALHCVVVYENETVIGILPLVRRGDGLQFLGAPQADYTDVLCEEERALEVLNAAFSALYESGRWKGCKFEHLPSSSRIVRNWTKLNSLLRRYSRLVFGYYCQTIKVSADCPDLFSKIAGKKKLRYDTKKLARLGVVKFRFLDTKLEAQEHLPRFFRYHARRRILLGENSSCHLPPFQRMMQGLVEELDPKDELRFGALEVNDTPVAFQFVFHTAGKYTLYQQTFDVNVWDHHPGNVLLCHMLLFASKSGANEFDFTLGAEPYKGRYANCVKEDFTLYLERRTVIGLIRCFARSIQGSIYHKAVQAKTRLQQYPKISEPIETARKWLRQTHDHAFNRPFTILKRGWSFLGRIGNLIWQSRDRLLLRLDNPVESLSASHEDVEVAACRLSDIADLLLENCDFPGNLVSWRTQIGRGDELFIVRKKGKAMLAVWTTNSPIAILPSSKKQTIDFESTRIICEPWRSPDDESLQSYGAVLAFLVRQAAERKHGLWVSCPSKDEAQKRELSRLGFEPKYHVRDWSICHWLRSHKVIPVNSGTGKLVFASSPPEEVVQWTTKTK